MAFPLFCFGLVGSSLAATVNTRSQTCSELSAPRNASLLQWPSDALSSRRVQAYEVAATWARVANAQSYTLCWEENTSSRTGGLSHAYERCVTQPGTKWNEGFVYYDTNGPVTAKVRANGNDGCDSSPWATLKEVSSLSGVSQICTAEKVETESSGSSSGPFTVDENINKKVYISKVERQVENQKGGSSYNVTVAWELDPPHLNKTDGETNSSKFEVCVGPTEDYNTASQGALSNYTCQYVSTDGKSSGTTVIQLDVNDPGAAYLSGMVRSVGYCTLDNVLLQKVTIATYYKIKVLNPIASAANGVDDVKQAIGLNPDGFHIVTTSRTTPDQTIDVNYFVSVLAGMLETWQLPVRAAPGGLVIHDTYITRFDGVVTLTSSNAGEDSSVAMSLYQGEGDTVTGLIFESYQGERAVKPEMYFKFATGKQTTIESKSLAKQCVTENDSSDEYDPPFKLAPCSKSNKKQAFLFEEFAQGWNEVGAMWVYTLDKDAPDLSFWKKEA